MISTKSRKAWSCWELGERYGSVSPSQLSKGTKFNNISVSVFQTPELNCVIHPVYGALLMQLQGTGTIVKPPESCDL